MTSLIDFSKPTNIISSEKYFNLSQKYRCLTSEAQINFLCNLIKNYKLNNNADIKNVDYDYILLTVEQKGTVANYLTDVLKINKDKIIL